MKQKILVFLQIFLAVSIVQIGIAFATEAGGSEDPLVAKSYVDDKINQVIELINSTVGTTEKPTTQITGGVFKPVLVEVGQTIYGKEGTELILRSGKGVGVVPGVEGIANLTKSTEVKNGTKVNKNELLIVPRDDGRGVKVTEKAWFLVKGGYEIK